MRKDDFSDFAGFLKKMTMVTDEQGEAGSYLICGGITPELLGVFFTGRCSKCSETIMFSPLAPTRPARICMACFRIVVRADPKARINITHSQAEEVYNFIRNDGKYH